jgi:hypothetical protein
MHAQWKGAGTPSSDPGQHGASVGRLVAAVTKPKPITCIQAIIYAPEPAGQLPWRRSLKSLNNMPITPKISILVAISMLGLFSAGLLAGYLMQKEMINSRVEQTRAIVEIAKNFA